MHHIVIPNSHEHLSGMPQPAGIGHLGQDLAEIDHEQ